MNARPSVINACIFAGVAYIVLLLEAFGYLLASAIALGVDFGVAKTLIHWNGWSYQIAAAASFTAGLLTIYTISALWVFRERAIQSRLREFLIFAVIGIAGLLLNALILHLGVTLMKYRFEYAKLISVAVVFFFNFALRKALLFTKGKN
jgi:putative flippase GtrA